MANSETAWRGGQHGQSVAASNSAAAKSMCAWCLEDSARTHAQRDCCRLRWLAKSPIHLVRAYALKLTETERDALRPQLAQEKRRLQLLRESAFPTKHSTHNVHR
jgi:hypothetical protein